jgi:hypothetical protein
MESLWKKVKKGFMLAAERTDELTKIGKLKLDIVATHRKIRRSFEELGGRTYELIKSGKRKKPLTDEKNVAKLIKEIQCLEKQLAKEEKALTKLQKKS